MTDAEVFQFVVKLMILCPAVGTGVILLALECITFDCQIGE